MQKQVSSSHPNIAKACNNIAKNVNEKTKIQGRKHLSFSEIFLQILVLLPRISFFFITRTILSHSRSKQNTTIKVLKTNGLNLLFLFFHANTTLDLMLISHMHATHLPHNGLSAWIMFSISNVGVCHRFWIKWL